MDEIYINVVQLEMSSLSDLFLEVFNEYNPRPKEPRISTSFVHAVMFSYGSRFRAARSARDPPYIPADTPQQRFQRRQPPADVNRNIASLDERVRQLEAAVFQANQERDAALAVAEEALRQNQDVEEEPPSRRLRRCIDDLRSRRGPGAGDHALGR